MCFFTLSWFSNHLAEERDSWLLYCNCVVAVCVMCLFLMVPWVGLQSVIVTFPGHTHLFVSILVLHSLNMFLKGYPKDCTKRTEIRVCIFPGPD